MYRNLIGLIFILFLIVISVYGFITKQFIVMMPYLILIIGIALFLLGLIEKNKLLARSLYFASMMGIIVSTLKILYN
ncbi:ABC-type Fe3+-siderophore transport system permease subunit [Bacillus sp. OAE603]